MKTMHLLLLALACTSLSSVAQTPASLPSNIRVMPKINLTVIADGNGNYTLVPSAALLRIDQPFTTSVTGALDPTKFERFEKFLSEHQSNIGLVKALPKPGDSFTLIVYDDDVSSQSKDLKLLVAVNEADRPISFFEKQAGKPLETSTR